MDVLHYMSETGASAIEAAATFNIPSTNTIYKWQNLLKEQGFDALQSKKKGRLTLMKKEKQKLLQSKEESLQERIKHLEMENACLKKLNALVQSKEKAKKKTK